MRPNHRQGFWVLSQEGALSEQFVKTVKPEIGVRVDGRTPAKMLIFTHIFLAGHRACKKAQK